MKGEYYICEYSNPVTQRCTGTESEIIAKAQDFVNMFADVDGEPTSCELLLSDKNGICGEHTLYPD